MLNFSYIWYMTFLIWINLTLLTINYYYYYLFLSFSNLLFWGGQISLALLLRCSLVGKTFWQILFHKQFRFISRIGSWEGRCEMKREIKMKGYMPVGKINVGRKACQSFFCIYSRLVQPNPSLPSQPLRSIFSCCILLTIYSTHELIRPNWLCLGKIGWLGLIFFFYYW